MENKIYKSYTNILFSNGGFFKGIMRTFDLFGTLDRYNESVTPAEADCKALFSDWQTVGNDIRNSLEKIENEK